MRNKNNILGLAVVLAALISFLTSASHAEQKATQTGTIEQFFAHYDEQEYSIVYDKLLNDRIKPLKSKSKFIKLLTEVRELAGKYQDRQRVGMSFGMLTGLTDDEGNDIDEPVSFKTFTSNWKVTFEHKVLYLDFVFVHDEDDTKLYLIRVKDNQLSASYERKI